MSKIFFELIDENYPAISHKCFNMKSCCEHLVSEKNIIGYVMKGTKKIDNVTVEAGEMFCISVGNYNVYYESAPGENIYEEVAVSFTAEKLHMLLTNILCYDEIKSSFLDRKNVYVDSIIHEPVTGNIKRLFEDLCYSQTNTSDKNISDMLDKIKITELLFSIMSDDNMHTGSAIVKLIKCNNDKIRVIISECIGSRVTVSEIAKKCSMSVSQFKKVFNHIYGSSPHKWFANQQLEKAAFLLRSSSKPIGEISADCEFSNPSHLIKRFKECYNMTPSEYRKSADKL